MCVSVCFTEGGNRNKAKRVVVLLFSFSRKRKRERKRKSKRRTKEEEGRNTKKLSSSSSSSPRSCQREKKSKKKKIERRVLSRARRSPVKNTKKTGEKGENERSSPPREREMNLLLEQAFLLRPGAVAVAGEVEVEARVGVEVGTCIRRAFTKGRRP